jgi:hypothetical protein
MKQIDSHLTLLCKMNSFEKIRGKYGKGSRAKMEKGGIDEV